MSTFATLQVLSRSGSAGGAILADEVSLFARVTEVKLGPISVRC